jgi:hypothetical protein
VPPVAVPLVTDMRRAVPPVAVPLVTDMRRAVPPAAVPSPPVPAAKPTTLARRAAAGGSLRAVRPPALGEAPGPPASDDVTPTGDLAAAMPRTAGERLDGDGRTADGDRATLGSATTPPPPPTRPA